MRKILALDPGLKATGWAQSDTQHGTIRADGLGPMKIKLRDFILQTGPDFLAIEDFVDEPWRRRRIPTSPEMGKLIGYIQAVADAAGIEHEAFPAGETKANMGRALRLFRNEHEFSAWCVLNFAAGWLRIREAAGQ